MRQETLPVVLMSLKRAFHSVSAHMETEAKEWQSIKKLCQREGKLSVRIGGIKMAEPIQIIP